MKVITRVFFDWRDVSDRISTLKDVTRNVCDGIGDLFGEDVSFEEIAEDTLIFSFEFKAAQNGVWPPTLNDAIPKMNQVIRSAFSGKAQYDSKVIRDVFHKFESLTIHSK